MILAAGRGERLRPLTDTCPKPLLPIHGRPMIEYHLLALKRAGVESVVVNISWLASMIEQTLGDGSRFGLDIHYSHELQALETAGGIIQALPMLDDEFIVVNGDVFSDFDFSRLIRTPQPNHLVLVENPEHNPTGDFSIDKDMLENTGLQCFTFSGIARYHKSLFDGLGGGRRALAPILCKGADSKCISAEIYRGEWHDVGTAERLDELQ